MCRSLANLIRTSILLLACLPVMAQAEVPNVHQGAFEKVTDSVSGNYPIAAYRMGSDGSLAVFLVTEPAEDPRGCFTQQQLRTIRTDGTREALIGQGFTWDSGVGNGCAQSLTAAFDISDDGTTIIYHRLNAPDNLNDELVVYDVVTEVSTSLLTQLPVATSGGTNPVYFSYRMVVDSDGF